METTLAIILIMILVFGVIILILVGAMLLPIAVESYIEAKKLWSRFKEKE